MLIKSLGEDWAGWKHGGICTHPRKLAHFPEKMLVGGLFSFLKWSLFQVPCDNFWRGIIFVDVKQLDQALERAKLSQRWRIFEMCLASPILLVGLHLSCYQRLSMCPISIFPKIHHFSSCAYVSRFCGRLNIKGYRISKAPRGHKLWEALDGCKLLPSCAQEGHHSCSQSGHHPWREGSRASGSVLLIKGIPHTVQDPNFAGPLWQWFQVLLETELAA